MLLYYLALGIGLIEGKGVDFIGARDIRYFDINLLFT